MSRPVTASKPAPKRRGRFRATSVMLTNDRAPQAMKLLRRYARRVGLPLQYALDNLLCEVLPGRTPPSRP